MGFSPHRTSYVRGTEAGPLLKIQDKDTTMPELVIDFITSLDGYAAAEGWPGWWGLEDPSTWPGWENNPKATTRS